MAENETPTEYSRIGDYVLVRVVGRGSRSTVYQALNPRIGRMVAVKIINAPSAPQPQTAPGVEGSRTPQQVLEARLRREARAVARLSHPNVLTIHDMGEHDKRPYLVMEYLDGQTLSQRLTRGPLPPEEVLGIVEQLADALDSVHTQGVLHRDLKPSSVMILPGNRVKIMDFGAARQHSDTAVTLMGEIVGSPAYMAPEVLRGEPASRSSDLWSLGVLLYEMLAGRPPFQGATFALTGHQVAFGKPAPLTGVSPSIQNVVRQALEKEPEKRFHRAREMADALREALQATTAPASRPAWSRSTAPRSAKAQTAAPASKRRVGLAVAAVGLIGCGFWVVGSFSGFLGHDNAAKTFAATRPTQTMVQPRPHVSPVPMTPVTDARGPQAAHPTHNKLPDSH